MSLGNTPRDCKAQTMSLMVVFNILHGKLIEDVLSISVGNFFSFVAYFYLNAVSYRFDGHLHNRSLTSKLYCIVKKRLKGDREQIWIGMNPGISVHVELKREMFPLCLFCELPLTVSKKIIQSDFSFLDSDAS